MADGVPAGAGRMLAAHEQRLILQAADEDDATVLLERQLVGTSGFGLDVTPLGLGYFINVEKLVITSNDNLVLLLAVFGGEETTGIDGQVALLVIPLLEPPGIHENAV